MFDPSISLLAATTNEGWKPGIGDPTFFGWATVVAYFVAAALCAYAAVLERRLPPRPSNRPRNPIFWRDTQIQPRSTRTTGPLFWWLLAALLVVLGVNKQLDLQSALTDLARDLAKAQGWYGERQGVQRVFVVAIALAGLIGVVGFALLFRRAVAQRPFAVFGLIFLVVFILIRAASFHHFDVFIKTEFLGLRMNWVLELGGITLVLISAIRHLRSSRVSLLAAPPESGQGNRVYRVGRPGN